MRRAALVGFLALAGCAHTGLFARVGAIHDPRSPSCAVRFERLTPQQAFAAGEDEVASGCVDDDDGDIGNKDDLRPEVCAVGGDLVIVTGTCLHPSRTQGLEVMVLAKRRRPDGA